MDIMARAEHGTYHVILQGKFTFLDNPEFRGILEHIKDPAIAQIQLDMEKVMFVDSAALGMLLLAHEEAEKYKKPLRVVGIQGQVKRIFDMAHFGKIFQYTA